MRVPSLIMTGINVIVNNSVRPHVASDYLLQDTINIRVKKHTLAGQIWALFTFYRKHKKCKDKIHAVHCIGIMNWTLSDQICSVGTTGN